MRDGADHLAGRSKTTAQVGEVRTGTPARCPQRASRCSLPLQELPDSESDGPQAWRLSAAEYLGASPGEVQNIFNLRDNAAERSFYTIEFLVEVLKKRAGSDENAVAMVEAFGRKLAFDALVGAQDRHAENWGIVEHIGNPTEGRHFAPIFDTSRGLFGGFPTDGSTHREGE